MKKSLRQTPVEVQTPKGHRFRILPLFCKGCRICVELCPTGTLDLDDRFRVKVAHPERCIACRMCELRCPDLAIYVTKADKGKAEGSGQKAEIGTEGEEGDHGEEVGSQQASRSSGGKRAAKKKASGGGRKAAT